ncbi:GspE/PulE family protein (plasmid) [Aminobacter sp. BA135]|uniref:GspE/PulE family protein n=1 Tax=Aminobacter sp. BA135 TaxID=537596 RepID=UPI003D7B3297
MDSLAQPSQMDGFLSYLEHRAILTAPSIQRVSAAFRASGQPFDTVVTELGLLREDELASHLSAFLELPPAQDDIGSPPKEGIGGMSLGYLQEHALLPLEMSEQKLVLAVADPFARPTIDAVAFHCDRQVSLRILPRRVIAEHLDHLGKIAQASSEGDVEIESAYSLAQDDLDRLKDFAREAPIVRFVAETITRAVDEGATDIHIEPLEDQIRIRFRHDGMLTTVNTASLAMLAGISTRVKILSRLNIAERRLPQDGRMRIAVRGRDVDLRVSIVPSVHGETMVLRILDRASVELRLGKLGYDDDAQRNIARMAQSANGIVLVTGPTGSGKTTTLYSILSEITKPDVKVFTVEDPVEYRLNGITQLQINPAIDLDFATALRSVLRQDPDTILIGEIRDRETAQIAIQAALTGHLVFSTLHTNSAAGALTRLRDMGIEGYLLGSTIKGVIAQRLLRRCCSECTTAPSKPVSAEMAACTRCNGTGYRGRTVTYEMLHVSPEIAALIDGGASEAEIELAAARTGMTRMRAHAMSLSAGGTTTIEEVRRVLDYGGSS